MPFHFNIVGWGPNGYSPKTSFSLAADRLPAKHYDGFYRSEDSPQTTVTVIGRSEDRLISKLGRVVHGVFEDSERRFRI
jgi:hypothetical protein